MLAANDVVGFLAHEHPLVRDHALRCLWLAGEHSGATAEPVLAAVDKFGAKAFAHLERIVTLPQTVASVGRAVQWLAVRGHPQWVDRWIVAVPQSLLSENPSIAADSSDEAVRMRLGRRLEMQNQSDEQLWSQLEATGRDVDASEDLLRVLAERDEFAMPRVMANLARAGSPLELAAIELAGLTHAGSAVGALVDRLEADDRAVASAATRALARIGTAGVITTIEQRCGRGSVRFRAASAECLGGFRVPSVEGTLLRLLIDEDDAEVRGWLCWALTDICTSAGFDRLYAAVREGAYSPKSGDLEASVAALARMLGRSLPESQAWEGQIRRQIESYALPVAAAHVAQPTGLPGATALQFPADAEGLEGEGAGRPAARSPIRRAETKVGRNDPCPCGSGKKYKKCCGA